MLVPFSSTCCTFWVESLAIHSLLQDISPFVIGYDIKMSIDKIDFDIVAFDK